MLFYFYVISDLLFKIIWSIQIVSVTCMIFPFIINALRNYKGDLARIIIIAGNSEIYEN